ncbi:tRNA hydroxylase [Endozoicomonas sp. (ex Bugula neritina AB1)]|nr:tRNA hydroxylase [Endozoicomonas sp. (ex Bugula neritina AB1)]
MSKLSVCDIPDELIRFLPCPTPQAWIDEALRQPDIVLIDHANCEKKAAATALNLMFRYVDKPELLNKMSRLAREELRHFEQVLALMEKRSVQYKHLPPSSYAGKLRKGVRTYEPERLVDTLIVGAFIEARSCERFAVLAPYLDEELQAFYRSLLKSEARHFQDYLILATGVVGELPVDRIKHIAELERQAIETPDPLFRFHSGVPVFIETAI